MSEFNQLEGGPPSIEWTTPDEEFKEAFKTLMASRLQADPLLAGLGPLYQDYESQYYWFEIPKFLCTLVLCGLVTLIPAEGASQVFLSLVVSIAMMLLFANCKPYKSYSDDVLSQFCQLSLTFTMSVGMLEKASISFQVYTSFTTASINRLYIL